MVPSLEFGSSFKTLLFEAKVSGPRFRFRISYSFGTRGESEGCGFLAYQGGRTLRVISCLSQEIGVLLSLGCGFSESLIFEEFRVTFLRFPTADTQTFVLLLNL